jgi:hypothetical protein
MQGNFQNSNSMNQISFFYLQPKFGRHGLEALKHSCCKSVNAAIHPVILSHVHSPILSCSHTPVLFLSYPVIFLHVHSPILSSSHTPVLFLSYPVILLHVHSRCNPVMLSYSSSSYTFILQSCHPLIPLCFSCHILSSSYMFIVKSCHPLTRSLYPVILLHVHFLACHPLTRLPS